MPLKLTAVQGEFAVCKIPSWDLAAPGGTFVFCAKTDEEISLVCESAHIPAQAIAVENGWRMFKIDGPLDFGMVGVIAGISALLAENRIPIFAISTFDTDYLLVRNEHYEKSKQVLRQSGYDIA